MKDKHTPGPWHHDEYGHICAGPQIIGKAYQFELDDSDYDKLPCIPNARLMAAAPEMYDALRDLYNASVLQGMAFDTAWQNAITLYEELTAKIEGDERP